MNPYDDDEFYDYDEEDFTDDPERYMDYWDYWGNFDADESDDGGADERIGDVPPSDSSDIPF